MIRAERSTVFLPIELDRAAAEPVSINDLTVWSTENPGAWDVAPNLRLEVIGSLGNGVLEVVVSGLNAVDSTDFDRALAAIGSDLPTASRQSVRLGGHDTRRCWAGLAHRSGDRFDLDRKPAATFARSSARVVESPTERVRGRVYVAVGVRSVALRELVGRRASV
jgi:hypothetical protein